MKNTDLLMRKNIFSTRLLEWNREQNTRQMPWKGEKDPYKIWLSEIILQQTRVVQGLSYYNNFINTFPDIHKLAKATDLTIFKLWEGLGYYARCRNLIVTARYISKDLQVEFFGKRHVLISIPERQLTTELFLGDWMRPFKMLQKEIV